jgi:hypothetical protein
MEVGWSVSRKELAFVAENRANRAIRILWDGAAIVDGTGLSHRVMHSGVRFMKRDQAQPPSTIVPGTRISDMVFPPDLVSFDHDWKRHNLFSVFDISKTIQVLLPYEVAGSTVELLFTFQIRVANPAALWQRHQMSS